MNWIHKICALRTFLSFISYEDFLLVLSSSSGAIFIFFLLLNWYWPISLMSKQFLYPSCASYFWLPGRPWSSGPTASQKTVGDCWCVFSKLLCSTDYSDIDPLLLISSDFRYRWTRRLPKTLYFGKTFFYSISLIVL